MTPKWMLLGALIVIGVSIWLGQQIELTRHWSAAILLFAIPLLVIVVLVLGFARRRSPSPKEIDLAALAVEVKMLRGEISALRQNMAMLDGYLQRQAEHDVRLAAIETTIHAIDKKLSVLTQGREENQRLEERG
ncbi:MAG: hypothetical protein HY347_11355 [candidate division NC10 bacterium]|nr:hypothetical protein [candidate division NC10 bacterium]